MKAPTRKPATQDCNGIMAMLPTIPAEQFAQ